MLDGVGSEAQGGFHRVGIRGVGHHGELALATNGEGGGQLVLEQEGMPVAVPIGAHDAAGEVELDVVDAVLDLLADGLDESVGAVALAGLPGGEEVAAGGGQEMSAGEHARAGNIAGVEDALPCHVHEVGRAAATHAGDSRFGQSQGEGAAEVGGFLRRSGAGRHRILGMDVDVPEARQKVGTVQINHPRVAHAIRIRSRVDVNDAVVLDDDRCVSVDSQVDRIDQIGVGEHQWHLWEPPMELQKLEESQNPGIIRTEYALKSLGMLN